MNGSALLENFTAQGISLFVKEGKLIYRAKVGVVTPRIKAELSAYKAELLGILLAKEAKEAKKVPPGMSTLAPPATTPAPDWATLFVGHCKRCGTFLLPDGSCALCATPLPF